MAEDEQKKLKRSELLERLTSVMRENEKLKAELAQAHAQLADRKVEVHDAGSIAEASLKLNDVFEAAQSAADQYLDNIERLYQGRGELVREAQSKAQAILAQAQLDAEKDTESVRQAAQEEADKIIACARVDADVLRDKAKVLESETRVAREEAKRAQEEAESLVRQAKLQAQEILDRANAEARETSDATVNEARANASAIVSQARHEANERMDEAERVSKNFELATKVRCDNTMRRAMNEAHVFGETLRMALLALGIGPEDIPALEKATGLKVPALDPDADEDFAAGDADDALSREGLQSEGASEKTVAGKTPAHGKVVFAADEADKDVAASVKDEAEGEGEGDSADDGAAEADASADDASDSPADSADAAAISDGATDTDADAEPAASDETGEADAADAAKSPEERLADIDQAVKSAREAVAAALSQAKTEPGTLDDDSVAAMYPTSREQL